MPWGTFIPILIFLHFLFQLQVRTGQTDRQMGKAHNVAYRTATQKPKVNAEDSKYKQTNQTDIKW